MPRGLVLPFPAPWGLTQDDLDCLYRYTAGIPGAQIDILTGRSRRTSAILALAGRRFQVDRERDTILVRDTSGTRPPIQDAALDTLLEALQTASVCGADAGEDDARKSM